MDRCFYAVGTPSAGMSSAFADGDPCGILVRCLPIYRDAVVCNAAVSQWQLLSLTSCSFHYLLLQRLLKLYIHEGPQNGAMRCCRHCKAHFAYLVDILDKTSHIKPQTNKCGTTATVQPQRIPNLKLLRSHTQLTSPSAPGGCHGLCFAWSGGAGRT